MSPSDIRAIAWQDDHIRILDQTRLPEQEIYLECRDLESVAAAIRCMAVRGAPAIGVAAALALALESQKLRTTQRQEFITQLDQMCRRLQATRPTAVNLQWALGRMLRRVQAEHSADVAGLQCLLREEALCILEEDIATNRAMGTCGQEIIPDPATVITICNTGSLATAGYGTALGVIRSAVARGKRVLVVACETRPLLQGARLTAWELHKDGIPFVLITDSMAGHYMRCRGADLVITGADRIAANGDAANKIGTYSLAVLAREHRLPFYVAAPLSTIDATIAGGDLIPIEERAASEVVCFAGQRIAPEQAAVWNPAFDVVPNKYIAGIITERGILRPPFTEAIRRLSAGA